MNTLHQRTGHVQIIDFLRGIASLMVVLFHFGCGGLVTLDGTVFTNTFYYGRFGVYVFFVISGFIVPYALYHSGYSAGKFFHHIGRRFLRIDPPAYVSVLLQFVLYYGVFRLAGNFSGNFSWPGVNAKAILANLTYTVDCFDTKWYNPVFWTLAIEFQFYILVGFLLPLLTKRNTMLTVITIVPVLLMFYIPFNSVLRFGCFFVMGILIFLEREKLLGSRHFYGLMLFAFVCCFIFWGPVQTCFALLTIVAIRFSNFSTRLTDHLGKVSFSLYLTHLFAGRVGEFIVSKFIFEPDTQVEKLIMLIVYIVWAVAFATVYHKFVERPFIRLSKKITWKEKDACVAEARGELITGETLGVAPAMLSIEEKEVSSKLF